MFNKFWELFLGGTRRTSQPCNFFSKFTFTIPVNFSQLTKYMQICYYYAIRGLAQKVFDNICSKEVMGKSWENLSERIYFTIFGSIHTLYIVQT